MTKKDLRADESRRNLNSLRLLLTVAVLIIAAGTMVLTVGSRRAFTGQGRGNGNNSQGSIGHNDDDWDDHDSDHHGESYAIGLWGDFPYSDVQAQTGVPNLILDMNSQDLAFTVHDGDLKAGSATAGSVTPTTCADAKYVQALNFFSALKAPAGFTPGDNDWVDCDTAINGNFNSLERLDRERQVFFSTNLTFGQHKFHQAVQTDTLTTPCLGFMSGDVNGTTAYKQVPCVENRRWTCRGVTYATLNIQGSCDNRCTDHPGPHGS